MILPEKVFYGYFVFVLALALFLSCLLALIFERSHDTFLWILTFFYTLYFIDFWNYKKTGETSAFRRDAFFIAQMFISAYMRWGM